MWDSYSLASWQGLCWAFLGQTGLEQHHVSGLTPAIQQTSSLSLPTLLHLRFGLKVLPRTFRCLHTTMEFAKMCSVICVVCLLRGKEGRKGILSSAGSPPRCIQPNPGLSSISNSSFWIQLSANADTGWQQALAQVVWLLPLVWETWLEFLVPSFCSTQPQSVCLSFKNKQNRISKGASGSLRLATLTSWRCGWKGLDSRNAVQYGMGVIPGSLWTCCATITCPLWDAYVDSYACRVDTHYCLKN